MPAPERRPARRHDARPPGSIDWTGHASANLRAASSAAIRVAPSAAIVAALIAAGADPNIADHRGFTPLHDAAIAGATGSVVTLLAAGADRRVTTRSEIARRDGRVAPMGSTAAELARFFDHGALALRIETG